MLGRIEGHTVFKSWTQKTEMKRGEREKKKERVTVALCTCVCVCVCVFHNVWFVAYHLILMDWNTSQTCCSIRRNKIVWDRNFFGPKKSVEYKLDVTQCVCKWIQFEEIYRINKRVNWLFMFFFVKWKLFD